jgi:VanZ family protein
MEIKHKRKLFVVCLSWAGVLIWMAVIFHLSAQVAEESDRLSKGVAEIIAETIEKIAPEAELNTESFNHIIRKNAHFTAYLVLGLLVTNGLHRIGTGGLKRILTAFTICVLYAISDEVHQLFVPGRGGQVTDVLIDSAGICIGVAVYETIHRFIAHRRRKISQ